MEHRPELSIVSPGEIYKIIYCSQISFEGGHEAVAEHVRDILAFSCDWNASCGISGALMVNARNFAQVLEGPAVAVKSLFGHIICDRRHSNVELLQAGLFETRDFGDWTMAFAGYPTTKDIELASASIVHDVRLGKGANSVQHLLRWLLLEEQSASRKQRSFG